MSTLLADQARALLNRLIDEQGLSNSEVARLGDTDHSTIRRFRDGEQKMSIDMFDRIIRSLGYGLRLDTELDHELVRERLQRKT